MITNYLLPAIFFLLGTAIGSFINVWSRRLLRGQSPTGRSRCEHCGHVLAAGDLVPLLSFALLRGRCRYCKKLLSWQYPIVEIATGILFAALSTKFPIFNFQIPNILALSFLLVATAALMTVLITDLAKQVIFDQTILVLLIATVLYRISLLLSGSSPLSLLYDVLGALGVYLFLQIIRTVTRKRGLGEGDPPLGFWAALLVGFPDLLVEIFLAFVIGGVIGAGLVLLRKKGLKDRIAFGPFLVLAAFAALFWGEPIWNWYLTVLGL